MIREFFRHGSNGAIAAGIVGLSAAAALGGPKQRPLPIAAGVLIFFASEYPTHRTLLHAKPSKNAGVYSLQRRLHYDHHVDPARLDLLFLPPWVFVPAIAAYGLAYHRFSRDASTTASLVFGNLLGLLSYEWVHYVAHIPYKPKTRYGRYIKKYHLRHHFMNEKLWFGVTNPLGDRFLGSYADVADAERSPSAKILYDDVETRRETFLQQARSTIEVAFRHGLTDTST